MASRVNQEAELARFAGLSGDDLDEEVHIAAENYASAVSSDGRIAQIAYIMGIDEQEVVNIAADAGVNL